MELKILNAPATKAQIKQAAAEALAAYPAEELIAMAIRMEAFASELRALAKGQQLDTNAFAALGIKAGETTRYDYSNSPAHVYLAQKLESVTAPVKAQIKDVEALAKSLAKSYERGGVTSAQWTDSETGETFDVRPAVATTLPKFELK